jgi:riboflavin synthase
MFSGIVECISQIIDITCAAHGKRFTVSNPFSDLVQGESIAINGVCLTVTDFTPHVFHVTAVPETLRLTNLDHLTIGRMVNIERALPLTSRLGGHYVQGHVDGTGRILELTEDRYPHLPSQDTSTTLIAKISIPKQWSKYLVNKGYIAIDGMSITLIDTAPTWLTVTFIPHTQAVTISKFYQCDTIVNIEIDMMAKHIEKLLGYAYDRHKTC